MTAAQEKKALQGLDAVLSNAVREGDEREVAALIRRGADIHAGDLLELAAHYDHAAVINVLMDHGLAPDIQGEGRDRCCPALHKALDRKNLAAAMALLERGACLGAPDSKASEALRWVKKFIRRNEREALDDAVRRGEEFNSLRNAHRVKKAAGARPLPRRHF